MTKERVFQIARDSGVADQIEIYERITQAEINIHLNRARANIVWSRREGFNRAVIEGMFAGVPGIQRIGFNFGFHQPYFNSTTGTYCSEADLPSTLESFIDDPERFDARFWVMEHMSCFRGVAKVEEAVSAVSRAVGEPWTHGLVPKVNELDGMRYLDSSSAILLKSDYEYLQSLVRTSGARHRDSSSR
jgi:hypothetical protein